MKLRLLLTTISIAFTLSSIAQKYQEGVAYYKSGYYEGARELLQDSFSDSNADTSMINYYLGSIALYYNNTDEARKLFDTGIKENSNNAYNYIGLGNIALRAGNKKDAEELFKKSENLSKKDVDITVEIARCYYDVDPSLYSNEIQKRLTEARKYNRQSPNIYILEGDQEKDKKNWGGAAGKYEMAKSYDSNATEAYVKYANLYTQVNPQFAIQMLKELLSVNPTSALGQRELANAYYNKKDYADAAREYGVYVQNPNHFKQDEDRYALLLFSSQDFQKGYDFASKLLAENPGNFTARRFQFMNAANLPAMADNLIPMSEELLSAHNANPQANKFALIDFVLMAEELTKAKRTDKAIAVLNEAIKEMPENAIFNKQLAMTYLEQEDFSRASDAYEEYLAKLDKPGYNDYMQQATFSYYAGVENKQKDAIKTEDYFNKTLNYAKKAESASPDNYRPYKVYGDIAIQRSTSEAEARSAAYTSYLQAAARIEKSENPSRYSRDAKTIYNYLGNYYLDQKNLAKAKENFNKYLTYDPNNQAYRNYVNNLNEKSLSAKPYTVSEYASNNRKTHNTTSDNTGKTTSNKNKLLAAKNVNEYISSNLPDFERFIKEKTASIEIPSAEKIKQAIEKDVIAWQTKGEFESTSDWNKRVNDNTRQERIDRLTKEWKEKTERAKALYDQKASAAQNEYQHMRNQYAEEFYSIKREQALEKCRNSVVSINSPYDADNQVFLINSSIYGDILLPVPISEAPAFKNNWEQIRKSIDYEFQPADESNVALSKIVFSNNGKKYTYDGQSEATYAIADVNYNFNPIEIEEIDFDISSLPVLSEATSIQTLNTTGISAKKVDVKRNTVNASTGESNKKTNNKQADIDKNIPKGSIERANTFALIIANENYRRVSEVPYALNDGATLKEYFNKTLGLPEKNILFAQDASLNDIKYNIKRLQDICGVFKGDASVLVYYAGHGVPDGKSLDAYLLPVDGYADDPGTGMALSELTQTLAALPSKQTTLFIDACFSGTGREGAMLSEARGVKLRPKETTVTGNLIVFSASQGVETAHPYDEQGHGMFTYYLLKKLNETQGKVKLGELADYLINNVSRTSVLDGNMQTPTVKSSLMEWENLEL